MKRTVDLGRAFFALFPFAAALVCGGTGQARGDFVLSTPSSSGYGEISGYSANSGGYFTSQQNGSPSVSESYSNGYGTSGTAGGSLSNSATLGTSSFTDSVAGSSSSSAASDGAGYYYYYSYYSPYTNGYSNQNWSAQLTIDKTSVATVSWNPTSFTFGSFNAPDDGSQNFGGYTDIYNNVSEIYVEGIGSESISANSPYDVFAGIQSYSSVSGYGTANSVSIVLSPGTYTVDSAIFSNAYVYGTPGYVGPNYTAGYGSITVNAISTPEPGSLTLLGMGLFAIGGVRLSRHRRRA